MTDNTTTLPTGSQSKLRDIVSSQLQILLEHKNYDGAKALLIPVQPVDIAEAISILPAALQAIAFRLLEKAKAIEVYEDLQFDVQQFLLEKFQAEEAQQIIESIAPDERVKLFDELPPQIVRRLIAQLSPEERQATSLLLGYQTDRAGHLMTPEYIALKEHLTATEAQERIRSLASLAEVTYELRGKKPTLVILRELMTGGMLGILLGILVVVAIFMFLGQKAIGFTVGLSLLSITLIAATTGAALPFIFHSFGLDPALMSAPFITTVVDILGILIYLNIARLLLGV